MEEFPVSHRDTVDDEHCFSSSDGQSVGEDHPDFRIRAKGMCSWEEHLPLVKFAYNNSYQVSIRMAPYEALYGRPCRSLVCWTEVGKRPSTGLDIVRDTSEKVDLIWKHFLTVQSRQKSYADKLQ